MAFLRLILCFVILLGSGSVPVVRAAAEATPATLTKVRVQLRWFHQYQFAGFYAALEQGYFRKAGLDVELIEGRPDLDPAEVVSRDDAEFGMGNSSLLIDYNRRGRPVMAVAAILQHSPFVIMARVDPNLRSVRDLEGRTLMGEAHSDELIAYLRKAGVNLERIRVVDHSGTIRSLESNGPDRVDAIMAYISGETIEASQLEIPYQIFNPRELGINFYGDTLFTSQQYAREHPQRVVAMRDALIEGWHYARQHQAEIVELILRQYAPKKDRVTLNLEALSIHNLFQSDIVDTGYMSRARWESIGGIFVETGLLPHDYALDGFLFQPEGKLPEWAFRALFWAAVLIVLSGALAAYIIWLNRRLRASLQQLAAASFELERLATTDPLTGLFNRRYFDSALEQELFRAGRQSSQLCLLMIDVDDFKKYNDLLGHPAGDLCLQQVAAILHSNTQRAGEFAARIGGEEFVVVASALDHDKALALAERIRSGIEATALPHPGSARGHVTVSIGVASIAQPISSNSVSELIASADKALYQAKHEGRNRSVFYA